MKDSLGFVRSPKTHSTIELWKVTLFAGLTGKMLVKVALPNDLGMITVKDAVIDNIAESWVQIFPESSKQEAEYLAKLAWDLHG